MSISNSPVAMTTIIGASISRLVVNKFIATSVAASRSRCFSTTFIRYEQSKRPDNPNRAQSLLKGPLRRSDPVDKNSEATAERRSEHFENAINRNKVHNLLRKGWMSPETRQGVAEMAIERQMKQLLTEAAKARSENARERSRLDMEAFRARYQMMRSVMNFLGGAGSSQDLKNLADRMSQARTHKQKDLENLNAVVERNNVFVKAKVRSFGPTVFAPWAEVGVLDRIGRVLSTGFELAVSYLFFKPFSFVVFKIIGVREKSEAHEKGR